ncbi:MAG: polyprenyl synthetase family protein [Anaerolineales bacterium]|nr:polyprenyl synthetase family protein [Anaerolineales bacterium]
MIAPSLVEAIWANPLIDRRYAEALRQLCLPADGAPARREGLARLPELFCEANGGDPAQVAPILSAWTLLRYAARILDDIQDGDMVAGEAASAVRLNLSTGLIFTSGALLSELEAAGVTAVAARDIRRTVYATLLQTCGGQHLDLSEPEPTLAMCWQIAGAKTGTFAGLICWCGGRVACADAQQLARYQAFGYNLGLLDQIGDDLADLWASDAAHSDLRAAAGRGLPAAYALAVLPPAERARLRALLAQSQADPASEQEARQVIIASGAAVYLTAQTMLYRQESERLLAEMGLPEAASRQLHALLDKVSATRQPA